MINVNIFAVMGPSTTEVAFNEMVNDVKQVVRESRHLGIGEGISTEVSNFVKFLDDVSAKEITVSDPDTYIMSKVLDSMDHYKDILDHPRWNNPETHKQNCYRVINSIYDILKEFYFNN